MHVPRRVTRPFNRGRKSADMSIVRVAGRGWRARMREARYRIPNHPRLLRQLRETVSVPGSGGQLTIRWPKWRTGEHGDLAQAFVHMAYQSCGIEVPAPPATREEQIRRDVEQHFDQVQREIDRERRGDDSTWDGNPAPWE